MTGCLTVVMLLLLLAAAAYQVVSMRPDLAAQLHQAVAPVLEHEQLAPLVRQAAPAAAAAHAATQQAVSSVAAGALHVWKRIKDEL
jgi:hypothetical protein